MSFVTYECIECNAPAKRQMARTLHDLGFICYMGGNTQLFARVTGCYDDMEYLLEEDKVYKTKYPPIEMNQPSQRLSGNVYCGHIRRSPGLIQAMESHSLHTYTNNHRGDPYFEALLGRRDVWVRNGSEIMLGNEHQQAAAIRKNARNFATGKIPVNTKTL